MLNKTKMKNFTVVVIVCFVSALAFGQETWHALENAPTNTGRIDDVFFINENVGWSANGSKGQVYKTTDGGASWDLKFTLEGAYFRNIEFLNENIGFLGMLSSQFYKTTDGGDSWELVNISTTPESICGLDAVGSSTIYGCGAFFSSDAWVIKSVDSGETWEYIDMGAYAQALVEILFVDEQLGYASGKGTDGFGVILKTTDGGNTWVEIYESGTQGDLVWKLQLLEDNTYLYGSVQALYGVENGVGKLIKSFDAGATWTTKEAPEALIQAVGFISPTHGWMGGHNTGFYETTDGGDTWTNTGIGGNLNRIFIINEHLAYASGATIYKFDDALAVTDFSINPMHKDLEVSIAPVPIVDKLNIDITFLQTDNLTIDLYDVRGRLVKRLSCDLQIPAGTKTYTFDFPYPAGTYFLDLHYNSGRQSETVVKQ